MATGITWVLNFTGTPTPDDIIGAKFDVRQKNAQIAVENVARAAQNPPLDPLPLLGMSTPAALKTSYLGLGVAAQTKTHASRISQGKNALDRIPPDKKEQALAFINTRLDAGESIDFILADLAS